MNVSVVKLWVSAVFWSCLHQWGKAKFATVGSHTAKETLDRPTSPHKFVLICDGWFFSSCLGLCIHPRLWFHTDEGIL